MDQPTGSELSPTQVDAVRARREALHEGVATLESVLDGLDHDAPSRDALRAPVEHLLATLREHARGAEAVDGPLAQVIDSAPWLGNRATRLRSEHPTLIARAEELRQRLADEAAGSAASVVADARALASQVTAHRHQAAALLIDAYSLDLSAGD